MSVGQPSDPQEMGSVDIPSFPPGTGCLELRFPAPLRRQVFETQQLVVPDSSTSSFPARPYLPHSDFPGIVVFTKEQHRSFLPWAALLGNSDWDRCANLP